MNKLLIVLFALSFNVVAEEAAKPIDRHYNTCRTSESAINTAKQQEEHYRNQLLFTLEKGSNSQRMMYETQLAQLLATREMIEKMYDTLKCEKYFNIKKTNDK